MESFPLFTRQRAQAQVRLRVRPWTVRTDEVAEVIHPAAIAARLHHRKQPRGSKRRNLLQGRANEWQIRLQPRGAEPECRARHARLIKDPLDRAVMQPELLGDGADAPVLGVEVTQDK